MKLMLYVGGVCGVGWGMLTFAGTYVMKLMLRWGAKRNKLLAREVVHQDRVYAKTLRSVPKHLSSVAETQCIDRHWRSVKEFIGATFPRKIKGLLGSKGHPGKPDLVHLWLYRSWYCSETPACVYEDLTHLWQQR